VGKSHEPTVRKVSSAIGGAREKNNRPTELHVTILSFQEDVEEGAFRGKKAFS